jgi:hypothetical protein
MAIYISIPMFDALISDVKQEPFSTARLLLSLKDYDALGEVKKRQLSIWLRYLGRHKTRQCLTR